MKMNGFGAPSFMFSIFPIFFVLVFLLVFGMIIYTLFYAIRNNNRNNRSPVLTVDATIVAKRSDIRHHHNNMDNNVNMSSSTWYYVTFQVESGDRMEIQVSGSESGLLVEGDEGKLTFQGTRFIKFDRT